MSKSKQSKKKPLRLYKHNTSRNLRDSGLVFKTAMECLGEGDYESFIEVLAASVEQMDKAKLERRYDIPRRTTYNLLERKSIPRIDLVAKICLAIKENE